MSFSLIVPHSGLLLDACSAIVLDASGMMTQIIDAVPVPCYIPKYVQDVELRSLDLRIAIATGYLSHVDLSGDEEALSALHFGTDPRMHTGEAVCAALAVHRDFAIATDDASAISFFTERLPAVLLVSSADLVRNWANNADHSDVVSAIRRIRDRDGYLPHKTHNLRSWWVSHL